MTIFWRVFLKLKKTLTEYISEAQMKTVQRLQIIKRVVIHTRLKGSITVMHSRYLKPTKRCSIIRHRCLYDCLTNKRILSNPTAELLKKCTCLNTFD